MIICSVRISNLMSSMPHYQRLLGLSSFVFCLAWTISGQPLTVREIMAEPSIAGTRAQGEKLSPDGTKVVYLWNTENKLPLDLYMTSTDGRGTPQVILRVGD